MASNKIQCTCMTNKNVQCSSKAIEEYKGEWMCSRHIRSTIQAEINQLDSQKERHQCTNINCSRTTIEQYKGSWMCIPHMQAFVEAELLQFVK